MQTHITKAQENKSQVFSKGESQRQNKIELKGQFSDNRPEVSIQRKLHKMANSSSTLEPMSHSGENTVGSLLSSVSHHASLIQREVKTVDDVEVDVGGGYTNWEGWHINWRLGGQDKHGNEQYHLTSEDRSQHYFFIINGDDVEDTKPKAHFVPKKGTHGGISKAPASVQAFVRRNIRQLMG